MAILFMEYNVNDVEYSCYATKNSLVLSDKIPCVIIRTRKRVQKSLSVQRPRETIRQDVTFRGIALTITILYSFTFSNMKT